MKTLTVKDVINTLDYNKIIDLGIITNNRYFQSGALEKYIQEKLSVAHYLNLHETKSKKLLDIGTGAGWFPYICKLYGHECLGTDIVGRENYDPIYKFLDIEVKEILVYPLEEFKSDEKFDYIVSLRSFFPSRPTVWSWKEWKFFFNDITKNLKSDGGIYLSCNSGIRGIYKTMPADQVSHWGELETGKKFKPFLVEPSKTLKIKPNTIFIKYNDIQHLGSTK